MTALHGQISKRIVVFGASIWFSAGYSFAQAPTGKPQEKSASVAQEKPAEPPNAAQIELLETKYRFESNGDSRKEVHALVKINSELGVRQFARLNFDYNRSFQSVEIPVVHITHTNGGTSDILPSAITDTPNPAVEKFPAYHDVRVKSVRILGLQPGDSLEYQVVTTTNRHPLAPNFWLDHSFDRSGVVTREVFEVDLPSAIAPPSPPPTWWDKNLPFPYDRVVLFAGQPAPQPSIKKLATGTTERILYRWELVEPSKKMASPAPSDASSGVGDIELVFSPLNGGPTWWSLSHQLFAAFSPAEPLSAEITQLAQKLTQGADTPDAASERVYDFVSQKIKTIDLPLGATGFRMRPTAEILSSGYATQEDKVALFMALGHAAKISANPVLLGPSRRLGAFAPRPSAFSHILVWCGLHILDPSLEVAPFGVLPASYRASEALYVGHMSEAQDVPSLVMMTIPNALPFPSVQRVQVDAIVAVDGKISTKVRYALRGDNELLLRVAFHKTVTEKQKEIAQYLALADGFRGKVTSVKTSDPYDADKPFEVEYEITQEKFVDWSKKPVRIPALLPLPGLPEAPEKLAAGANIELGPPLEVDLSGTLKLPAGTTAQVPTGTSVKRDYATFVSQYSAAQNVLHFSRRLNFISSELPAERSLDLNAFLHAVQNDQALLFELDRPASVPPTQPK